jgi:hypothetical protein
VATLSLPPNENIGQKKTTSGRTPPLIRTVRILTSCVTSADPKPLLAACTIWTEDTAKAGLRKNALLTQVYASGEGEST